MRLEVQTHDFKTHETEVEAYDPVELNDQLNNTELNTVVIGDLIFSRINVKSIAPIAPKIEEEEVAE